MNDIKRVEKAKQENPEMYNEAVRKLKGEVKIISSIEELKAKAKEMDEKEMEDGDE
jgi:RNA polymerase-interacting CarD/CdnL/TRCF family regulator